MRQQTAQSEAAIDRGLVSRFNGGDEAAFNEIVGRYRDKIQNLAMSFLRNHADAEEVAQDTFIRAHRGLVRFRGDASLATWLHRIAVNLARNRYWYFFRRRQHLSLSLNAPLTTDTSATYADLLASREPNPAHSAITDEFGALVVICMERLDVGQREILSLRNRLHHTYDEIAEALQINKGTVKSRIARARGKLRQLMADSCPEISNEPEVHDWFEPMRTGNPTDPLVAA